MPELIEVYDHPPGFRCLSLPDFGRVRELALSSSGITLQEQKRALVSSRLEKLVRHHGFRSFSEYISFVSRRRHGPEFIEFIDTLTTNHSGFWREPEHFTYLQKSIFPAKRNRLRIWSSACATGEEPLTIAMCALEAGLQGCSITASDISRTALAIARRGVYSGVKLSSLPSAWARRYFSPADVKTSTHGSHLISHNARALVHYSPLNLLHPFAHLGQFDVIFCRNVMIYFEQATRDELIVRLARQLQTGGYLLTGHSETLLRLPPTLEYVQPAVYRRTP